jgi:hypothetical protein
MTDVKASELTKEYVIVNGELIEYDEVPKDIRQEVRAKVEQSKQKLEL